MAKGDKSKDKKKEKKDSKRPPSGASWISKLDPKALEKAKKSLGAVESVIFLLLIVNNLYSEGASMSPFYFPITSFLWWLLILLAVLLIQGLLFTYLFINCNTSHSVKADKAMATGGRRIPRDPDSGSSAPAHR